MVASASGVIHQCDLEPGRLQGTDQGVSCLLGELDRHRALAPIGIWHSQQLSPMLCLPQRVHIHPTNLHCSTCCNNLLASIIDQPLPRSDAKGAHTCNQSALQPVLQQSVSICRCKDDWAATMPSRAYSAGPEQRQCHLPHQEWHAGVTASSNPCCIAGQPLFAGLVRSQHWYKCIAWAVTTPIQVQCVGCMPGLCLIAVAELNTHVIAKEVQCIVSV